MRLAQRLSVFVTLAFLPFGRYVAPFTDEEADMIADPGARMLHGKRKAQAILHKGTDPFLLITAFGAIFLARLRGTVVSKAPAPAQSAPRRDASASAPPGPPPAAPSMTAQAPATSPAAAPGATARPGAGGGGTPLDNVDLSTFVPTKEIAQGVLDELYNDMRSAGRA